MLEQSKNKISVLNKMIGLGEEVMLDNSYLVPQNSVQNIKHLNQKMGLSESQRLGSSTCDLKRTSDSMCRCPNCENMAKNFLFLESLIRSNCNSSNTCNVCHSSLQYLQTVNKSIMKVFGNSDNIAQAAKAFGHQLKPKTTKKFTKLRGKSNKKLTSSSHSTNKPLAKKRTTTVKAIQVVKTSKKSLGSHANVHGPSKTGVKSRVKKTVKKSNFKKDTSTHSATVSTGKPTKSKKLSTIKTKTKNLFRKLKSIN